MALRLWRRAGDRLIEIVQTDRADGDLATAADGVAATRSRIWDTPVTWLRQVHGADVIEVGRAGEATGTEADGAVTDRAGAALAVLTADCAPVVCYSARAVGIAHAGWRGLRAGVVERTIDAVAAARARPVRVLVGPCIRPAGYEFGADTLDELVDRFGPVVASTTTWGTPAFDVAAAVGVAARAAGAVLDADTAWDTAEERWFSHRTRGERGRQATTVCLRDL